MPREGPPRRRRAEAVGPAVSAYVGVVTVLGVVAVITVVPDVPRPPQVIPWWLLAVGCVIAESFVFHLRFGRESASISPGEIVLAIGLVFTDPWGLVAARLVGQAAVHVVGRSRVPAKVVFNLSLMALATAVALWMYTVVLDDRAGSASEHWRAVLVATTVAGIVNLVTVNGLMQLHRRAWQPTQQMLVPLASTFSTAILGALAVVVLSTDVLAGGLLLVVGAILFSAYQIYDRLRDQHDSLTSLQDLTRAVGNSLDEGSTSQVLLEQTRTLLRAEIAGMVVTSESPPVRLLLTGDTTAEGGAAVDDPILAEVASSDTTLLATTKDGREDVRSFLTASGLRDAIVVPLLASSTTGALVVGNRTGDARTFTHHDRQLLEAIAHNASVLLDNGRLVTRLRHEAADKAHQAAHDALTGLFNRTSFNQVVADAVEGSSGTGAPLAVLLVGLNGFKDVNDTLGHHTGDLILAEMAVRLRRTLPGVEAIARLGGDEYGVLLTDVDDVAAMAAAASVHTAIETSFRIDDLELFMGAGVGIALHPQHADSAELLIQRAAVAMDAVKKTQSGCAVYEPDQDAEAHHQLTLAADLRRALEDRDLGVHFQPKAAVGSGAMAGVEALVRWNHPQRGFVPPDEFIPIAERTGLIHELTRQVIDLALAQHTAWNRVGHDVNVAVNVAASTILARGFLADLQERLAIAEVPATALTLEVTESQVMADPEAAITVLGSLRAMGVRVSIDDFGTGHSSLSQLKRLPVDELKIDRSFVFGMCTDEEDAVIVRAMIDLAHNLGLEVVAEGVEDAETWECLASLGCESAQGYYLSRPVPAADLSAWITDNAAAVAL